MIIYTLNNICPREFNSIIKTIYNICKVRNSNSEYKTKDIK